MLSKNFSTFFHYKKYSEISLFAGDLNVLNLENITDILEEYQQYEFLDSEYPEITSQEQFLFFINTFFENKITFNLLNLEIYSMHFRISQYTFGLALKVSFIQKGTRILLVFQYVLRYQQSLSGYCTQIFIKNTSTCLHIVTQHMVTYYKILLFNPFLNFLVTWPKQKKLTLFYKKFE